MFILKDFARKFEIDEVVIFSLFSKSWTVISGPISVFLVTSFFSKALQGYYYTFSTILALQVFVEMGLGTVTQQFVSHEWSKLRISESGNIIGDEAALSRLLSIAKISFKWFFYGSVISSSLLLVGGYIFFSTSVSNDTHWQLPWVFLSILAGFNIFLTPFWSILEGCNQITTLYRFRLAQTILLSISTWVPIFLGAGLWVSCIISLVGIMSSIIFFLFKYFNFFRFLLFNIPTGVTVKWHTDMFPMQWRIAVAWISGYFSFSLFTPILFKYQGPEIAGQFGLTWSLISTMGGFASSWLVPRVPTFGILIAQKKYYELDQMFKKIVLIVFIITLSLSILFFGFIYLLPTLHNKIASNLSSRLLPPLPVALLLIAQILFVTSTPFSYYLRAHKIEPLMLISVLSGLIIAASTYYFGKNYSVKEVLAGYLATNIVFIPIVILKWYHFRNEKLNGISSS